MPKSSIFHGNPLNKETAVSPRSSSRFDDSYNLALTSRFGEYTPTFVADVNPKEKHSLRNVQKVTSLNLSSPLMQNLILYKDFYNVPLSCILPKNWDKVYNNPTIGDDVDIDVNCVVPQNVLLNGIFSVWKRINDLLCKKISVDDEEVYYFSTLTSEEQINLIVHYFFIISQIDNIFSFGGLLNYLGCNLNDLISVKRYDSEGKIFHKGKQSCFDEFIESFYSFMKDRIKGRWVPIDSGIVYEFSPELGISSFRDFIQYLHYNGCIVPSDAGSIHLLAPDSLDSEDFDPVGFCDDYVSLFSEFDFDEFFSNYDDVTVNLARVFAYQLAVSHFYSNDSVDYIYSAELYRENLRSLYRDFFDNFGTVNFSSISDFEYNGISCEYDSCSGHFLTILCSIVNDFIDDDDENFELPFEFYAILSTIFSFRPSLRYVDYFTGARTRPLAIGDTSVPVSFDSVDVVDITRNIQIQRFLNAVNRTGRKIADYISGIFGDSVSYDFHDPEYLVSQSENIFGVDIQNTAEAQQTQSLSTTSILRGDSNKYMFEFNNSGRSIPSVLIGISYFDLPRLYFRTTDRSFFHQDRFDMFNPFLEHIGDQKVYMAELSRINNLDAFGYQTRYAEYKQRVSRAVGGFVHNLPGFAFLADPNLNYSEFVSNTGVEYIRSRSTELDRYFTSLTGISLSYYWHFITMVNNICDDYKSMSAKPNIL